MSGHEPATPAQKNALMARLNKENVRGWEAAQAWMRARGVRVESFDQLTKREASMLIGSLVRLQEESKHNFTNGK